MAEYTPEMRERTLRMLSDARQEHPNLMTAIRDVVGMLGMSSETLRMWRRRYEVDAGERPGVTWDVLEENRRLKREVGPEAGERDIEVGQRVFHQGTRPAHDEMILFNDQMRDRVAGRAPFAGCSARQFVGFSPPADTGQRKHARRPPGSCLTAC